MQKGSALSITFELNPALLAFRLDSNLDEPHSSICQTGHRRFGLQQPETNPFLPDRWEKPVPYTAKSWVGVTSFVRASFPFRCSNRPSTRTTHDSALAHQATIPHDWAAEAKSDNKKDILLVECTISNSVQEYVEKKKSKTEPPALGAIPPA